jgi:hypothetical protein
MARSITDIKKQMTDAFMADENIREAYGFVEGDTFNGKFSSVSIESILFYIVAACIYTFEVLFDSYREDVNDTVETSAHTARWYRDKALAFMRDVPLVEDADYYDTSDMTDEEIEQAKVVKYAAATESKDSSLLTIKVATKGNNGELQPLDQTTDLAAYLAEIKDAGVRINLINRAGDVFFYEMDVYYNPLINANTVKSAVEDAVKNYVQGLPFDGQYSNMGCIDAVQKVAGVEVAEIKSAVARASSETTMTLIDARYRPSAGYMTVGTAIINMKVYDEQI